jgi:hypothetical protein
MRKFEFDKSYEEIEVGGEVYRVDMSDEKIKQYQKTFAEFYKEAQQISEADFEKMPIEEQTDLLEKQKKTMKKLTETLLGEGTFDKLYEQAGRSTANFVKFLMFIGDIYEEKTDSLKSDARKKYVKKK